MVIDEQEASVRVGPPTASPALPTVLPPMDAEDLTRAILGAVTGTTGTALDLAQVASGNASADAPSPTAEDVAAVQQALGLVIATS